MDLVSHHSIIEAKASTFSMTIPTILDVFADCFVVWPVCSLALLIAIAGELACTAVLHLVAVTRLYTGTCAWLGVYAPLCC